MSKSVQHLQDINLNDEWETPMEFYQYWTNRLDIHPKLDVCASKNRGDGKTNAKCKNYFTKEIDGLKQNWVMTFWMNPPYSQVNRWIQKAVEQHDRFGVNGICLTYGKIGNRWFHKYIYNINKLEWKFQMIPIPRRMKFLINGKVWANTAPYDSCLIVIK